MAFVIKNKKWLGYTLYVVLVTLFLLFYLFPSRTVEEFIDQNISRINPAVGFRAGKIGLWIPAGMRIKNGQIYLDDLPSSPVFKADSIYIGPRILQLLMGKYSIELAGNAYGGEINGSFKSEGKDKEIFAGELTFKNLDLADYEFLARKFPHTLEGKISGDIEYSTDTAGVTSGIGRGDLRLTDGQLRLQAPVFGISTVDLRSIEAQLELGPGEVKIVKAELSGSEVNGTMNGTILLQPNIGDSALNLKGSLEPLAEFYKKYPEIRELLKSMRKRVKRGQYFFVITGTLDAPIFKLL